MHHMGKFFLAGILLLGAMTLPAQNDYVYPLKISLGNHLLPAGLYLVYMQAGEFKATKKLLMVK
jgi:hypothetical protein